MSLVRRNLNKNVSVGQFYDATTDNLINGFAFSSPVEVSTENRRVEIRLRKCRNQRLTNLLVLSSFDEELRLSLIVGLAESQGVARLLNFSDRIDDRTRFLSVRYFARSEFVSEENSRGKLSSGETFATHFLVSTNFGIDASIVLRLPDDEQLAERIQQALQQIPDDFRLEQNQEDFLHKIAKVSVFSNFSALDEETNLVDFFRKFAFYRDNLERFPAISFDLRPLDENGARKTFFNFDLTKILRFEREILLATKRIEFLRRDLRQNFEQIRRFAPQRFQQIQNSLLLVEKFHEERKRKISELVVNFRRGFSNVEQIEQMFDEQIYDEFQSRLDEIERQFLENQRTNRFFAFFSTKISSFDRFVFNWKLQRFLELHGQDFMLKFDEDQWNQFLDTFLQENFDEEKIQKNEKIILFFGQRQAGQSTLIRSFYRYLCLDSFDPNQQIHRIQFNQTSFILLDGPTFPDQRGLQYDRMNFNRLISLVNRFQRLDAVCFVVESTLSELLVHFKFIFTKFIQLFGPTISNHLVFAFTHCRASFFGPGSTGPILRRFLHTLPLDKDSFRKQNLFFFENQSLLRESDDQIDPFHAQDFIRSIQSTRSFFELLSNKSDFYTIFDDSQISMPRLHWKIFIIRQSIFHLFKTDEQHIDEDLFDRFITVHLSYEQHFQILHEDQIRNHLLMLINESEQNSNNLPCFLQRYEHLKQNPQQQLIPLNISAIDEHVNQLLNDEYIRKQLSDFQSNTV